MLFERKCRLCSLCVNIKAIGRLLLLRTITQQLFNLLSLIKTSIFDAPNTPVSTYFIYIVQHRGSDKYPISSTIKRWSTDKWAQAMAKQRACLQKLKLYQQEKDNLYYFTTGTLMTGYWQMVTGIYSAVVIATIRNKGSTVNNQQTNFNITQR